MRPAQSAAPLAAARRLQHHPTMGRPRFVCRGRPAPLQRLSSAVVHPQPLPLEVLQLGEPGEVDMVVGCRGELRRAVEHEVHRVQRLEDRIQRRAAALPQGLRRLLAGAVAGAAGKTSTAPLETVKMQLVQSRSLGTLEAVQTIWRRGGLRGFFRGNTVDVLRTIPSRRQLSTYEYLKRVLRRWNRKHTMTDELHIPDAMLATLAGGLAGICALVAVYPLETIRTRQALGLRGNFVQAMAGVARTEGVPALYKGLDASVAGVLPYAAIRLASYDAMKGMWRRSTGRKDIDPQAAFLFGALAGVVSATATYPLEVMRRRMMAGAAHPHVVSLLREILYHEGPAALFNGVGLTLVKQAPTMAITFAAFEMAKQFLEL